jgi:hypothetical protein
LSGCSGTRMPFGDAIPQRAVFSRVRKLAQQASALSLSPKGREIEDSSAWQSGRQACVPVKNGGLLGLVYFASIICTIATNAVAVEQCPPREIQSGLIQLPTKSGDPIFSRKAISIPSYAPNSGECIFAFDKSVETSFRKPPIDSAFFLLG